MKDNNFEYLATGFDIINKLTSRLLAELVDKGGLKYC